MYLLLSLLPHYVIVTIINSTRLPLVISCACMVPGVITTQTHAFMHHQLSTCVYFFRFPLSCIVFYITIERISMTVHCDYPPYTTSIAITFRNAVMHYHHINGLCYSCSTISYVANLSHIKYYRVCIVAGFHLSCIRQLPCTSSVTNIHRHQSLLA